MYARTISFTLLAPSIWPLVEAVAKTSIDEPVKRYLMRSNNNAGIVMEIFSSKTEAAQNLGVVKAIQALNEQAMAKVAIAEGDLL